MDLYSQILAHNELSSPDISETVISDILLHPIAWGEAWNYVVPYEETDAIVTVTGGDDLKYCGVWDDDSSVEMRS